MITVIDSQGGVKSEILQSPEFDIFKLRSRIANKLSVWHSGRNGDPFDIPEWHELEKWLKSEVKKHIPEGGHVVFINHQDLVGLPWHVALAPEWRCSYATGWFTVLESAKIQYSNKPIFGVFAAPRYQDTNSVFDAISTAVKLTQSWAESNGFKCNVSENESADREAFKRLIAECDVIELYCHGYADPNDLEIALLVSHNGFLPPIHAKNKTLLINNNLLSWRDLQSFSRTPSIVLSAACSTGLQWQAGAGEQMGLFGALRNSGTKSVIAPRWDIVASDVIPMLNSILEKHFCRKVSLIDALHETCLNAEKYMPRWLAWSLTLEGNWL